MPIVAARSRPVTVQGVVGADQAWSRVPPDDLKAQGIYHLLRYTQDPGAKGMDQAEVDLYVPAGITITAINESFAQAFSRGYNQGVTEATYSFARLEALGFGRDRIVYFVGEDPSPVSHGMWPTIADAFRGVRDVALAQGRPLQGYYGSGDLGYYLLNLGLISREWHVSTWAGCDRSRAAIVQEANGLPGYGTYNGAIDLNTIYEETVHGDWGQHPFASPTPQPEEPEVAITRRHLIAPNETTIGLSAVPGKFAKEAESVTLQAGPNGAVVRHVAIKDETGEPFPLIEGEDPERLVLGPDKRRYKDVDGYYRSAQIRCLEGDVDIMVETK